MREKAEQILDSTQTTKSYLGPPGVKGFNSAMTRLIFGEDSAVLNEDRVRTDPDPRRHRRLAGGRRPDQGGYAGGNRLGQRPDLGQSHAIFPAAGLKMESYPYFDREKSDLRFDDMMSALRRQGPGDVVLFHACCHNPCGVSPNPEQWEAITDLAADAASRRWSTWPTWV